MSSRPSRTESIAVLRRAVHPPLGEPRFWMIQAMVVLIAGLHLLVDLHSSIETSAVPDGLPVALLIIPVGYAALRYALAGSAATGLWATLLWLPDLLLPHGRGHPGADLVNLALIDVMAFFVGQRIEAERFAHDRVQRVSAQRVAAEARYRQLFEANQSPILVLDDRSTISDANPAATTLFGADVVGQHGRLVLGGAPVNPGRSGEVLTLADRRDYRLDVAVLPGGARSPSTQVILEDVTEERSEGRRATRYAQLVVRAEEDQRRRLSRELHDEPLQLFLHLARRLERLGKVEDLPSHLVGGLDEARGLALDAAGRLRNLARDLRPPALDQLGLVAALSSLVADVEDETSLVAKLEVSGPQTRLTPETELGAFRIVQEALRNTIRHANAHEVRICVVFLQGQLALGVFDDGSGFTPDGLDDLDSDRLGLLGMRERTVLLGGSFEVRSTPGSGTVVEATIPITAARLDTEEADRR